MEGLELILVAVATAVAATISSATGFGFALVLSPALFAVVEPEEAITVLLILSALVNALILFAERRAPAVRRRDFAELTAWSLPGLVAGVLILLALTKSALQVIVGICVLVALAFRLRNRAQRNVSLPVLARPAAGFAAGALTTTTGTSGPPLVLFLERAGATPVEFRDTIAALFLALDVAGAVAFVAIAADEVLLPDAVPFAILMALVIVFRPAGRAIFERMDAAAFKVAVFTLISATAVASIVAGLA